MLGVGWNRDARIVPAGTRGAKGKVREERLSADWDRAAGTALESF